MHVSRYIHLNPFVNGIESEIATFKYSSLQEYLKISNEDMCKKEYVLNNFSENYPYSKFVEDYADYATSLEAIKHQVLD